MTRRFVHALGNNIGPDYDIPAPDVGTNAQIMAWAMDTYMNTVGHFSKQSVKGIVTGGNTGILIPFHSGRWLYVVSWVTAGIFLVLAWLILRGRLGRSSAAHPDLRTPSM